jgi:ribose transport system ATP-binding protein
MMSAAALDTPHDSVVALSGIWKSFGSLPVLKDVSIELRRGEVHVLLGENGAGKSTLVNVMIGSHAPDRGEVRLHARPVNGLTPFLARQLGVNAVMQDFSLAPAMTVAENYFLGREETRGPFLRKSEMRVAARTAIHALGVTLDVDTLVSDLSRPEQQLLEIVRALGGRPGALILDEPTATLSHDESELLFSTLDRLRRDGWAILYITHRLNEVHRLADRITILRDGSVVAQYEAGQASDDRLIRDMVGRSLETFYPAIHSQAGDVAIALVGVTDKNGRVADVSLNVRYGEIVGVGGLVGCGKGEIGAIIFALDALQVGHIDIDGRPRRFTGPRDALRHGIVYLPQDRRGEALILNRSAAENMTIERVGTGDGAAWGFLKTGSLSTFVRSMISLLDIRPPDPKKPAQEFSGGNQQKLVLGRALSRPRKIFVFCEPTAGIDVGARLDFYRQMERLCQEGAAILLISSDLQELIHLSHRIYVMHRGRVAGELTGDQRTEDEVTRYAFGG